MKNYWVRLKTYSFDNVDTHTICHHCIIDLFHHQHSIVVLCWMLLSLPFHIKICFRWLVRLWKILWCFQSFWDSTTLHDQWTLFGYHVPPHCSSIGPHCFFLSRSWRDVQIQKWSWCWWGHGAEEIVNTSSAVDALFAFTVWFDSNSRYVQRGRGSLSGEPETTCQWGRPYCISWEGISEGLLLRFLEYV